MRTFGTRIAILAAALSLAACEARDEGVGTSTEAATASTPDTYPFAMGSTNIQVGTISVWNDADGLYVRYDMLAGYELANAHVCASLTAFPWTPPGQCPYQQDPMPPDTTSWTFTIPWSDLGTSGAPCDALVYLQVHASVNAAATDAPVGSAYAGTFKGRIAYTVTCDPPPDDPQGCTYTQGYWKTHAGAWPVSSLLVGDVTYSKSYLINSVLKAAPRGDCSLIMGDQLVSSLLNVASGASTPPDVAQAISDGQAWMTVNKDADGLLPYGLRPTPEGFPNPAAWDEAINIGAALDQYNNGFDGPPHCP